MDPPKKGHGAGNRRKMDSDRGGPMKNKTIDETLNPFETGIYTIADASHLTGINSSRIRRWMTGYSYPTVAGGGRQPPMWKPEGPVVDEIITISFKDLLEIRWVNAFRNEGVPLQNIRKAIKELGEIYGVRYPLSRERVFIDGKALLIELQDESGRPLLYEVSGSRNYTFWSVALPFLRVGVIFEHGDATKWKPNEEKYSRIIVDPQVAFGRPVVEGTRLDTEVLASAFSAEQSYEKVGDWYGIDSDAVKQAVSFHKQLKAA